MSQARDNDKTDLASHTTRSRTRFNPRSGVVFTPPFFINGVRYQRSCDLQGLLEAIAQASNY